MGSESYIYMGTESVVDTPYNKGTGPQEDKKRKQKRTARCKMMSLRFCFLYYNNICEIRRCTL